MPEGGELGRDSLRGIAAAVWLEAWGDMLILGRAELISGLAV